jgi:hypothetical protein
MSSAVALLLEIHQLYTNQRVLLIKIVGVIFISVFRFDAAFLSFCSLHLKAQIVRWWVLFNGPLAGIGSIS